MQFSDLHRHPASNKVFLEILDGTTALLILQTRFFVSTEQNAQAILLMKIVIFGSILGTVGKFSKIQILNRGGGRLLFNQNGVAWKILEDFVWIKWRFLAL